MPVTGAGAAGVLEVAPCPSCPTSFAPQHATEPSTTAHVVSPPAASALAGQHPCEAHWKKPGLQVNPHLLASHLLVACCGVAQTSPHVPQLFTSFSVDTQAVPPQSC